MSHVNHDSLLCDKFNEECPQCHHPELEYYTKQVNFHLIDFVHMIICPSCSFCWSCLSLTSYFVDHLLFANMFVFMFMLLNHLSSKFAATFSWWRADGLLRLSAMQTQVFNQHIMEHFSFILDINNFHRFTFFLYVPSNSSYLRESLLSHGNGVVFYVFFIFVFYRLIGFHTYKDLCFRKTMVLFSCCFFLLHWE